jgi:glycerol uptake facilitator protein
MASPLFGEFMGTAVLILLGNGVVANVLLKKSKGEGGGWIVISAGWAFAVLFGVMTAIACGSHDANLNPAVTLGFAIVTGDFSKLGPYILAQLLGAMVGAVLVWLHYLPHWEATEDPDLKLACFGTSPAISRFGANLVSEITRYHYVGQLVLTVLLCLMLARLRSVVPAWAAGGRAALLHSRGAG